MLKVKRCNIFRSVDASGSLGWLVVMGACALTVLGGSCQAGAQPGTPIQAVATDNQNSRGSGNPVGTQSQGTELSDQAEAKPANPIQQESPAISKSSNQEGLADPKQLSEVTRDAVEKEWASLESSSGIDDAVKETLRPIYREAIDNLKKAEVVRREEAEYRNAIITAPPETIDVTRKYEQLPTLEVLVVADAQIDAQDLQKTISKRHSMSP